MSTLRQRNSELREQIIREVTLAEAGYTMSVGKEVVLGRFRDYYFMRSPSMSRQWTLRIRHQRNSLANGGRSGRTR